MCGATERVNINSLRCHCSSIIAFCSFFRCFISTPTSEPLVLNPEQVQDKIKHSSTGVTNSSCSALRYTNGKDFEWKCENWFFVNWKTKLYIERVSHEKTDRIKMRMNIETLSLYQLLNDKAIRKKQHQQRLPLSISPFAFSIMAFSIFVIVCNQQQPIRFNTMGRQMWLRVKDHAHKTSKSLHLCPIRFVFNSRTHSQAKQIYPTLNPLSVFQWNYWFSLLIINAFFHPKRNPSALCAVCHWLLLSRSVCAYRYANERRKIERGQKANAPANIFINICTRDILSHRVLC